MANSARQNPNNKVGRNSGAGDSGISEIVPTPAEARRGLRPLDLEETGWPARLGIGLGFALIAGFGIAYYAAQRAQRNRSLGSRLQRLWDDNKSALLR